MKEDWDKMGQNIKTIGDETIGDVKVLSTINNTLTMLGETVTATTNMINNATALNLEGAEKDLLMAGSFALGTGLGYLSGDMYDHYDKVVPTEDGKKQIIIDYGMKTNDKKSKDNTEHTQINLGDEYKVQSNTNDTHYKVIGDAIQSIGYAFGAIDITAVRSADNKEILLNSGNVVNFAHSQGTGTSNAANRLLEYRGITNINNVKTVGVGGQQSVIGIYSASNRNNNINIINSKDPVPNLFQEGKIKGDFDYHNFKNYIEDNKYIINSVYKKQ